MFKTSKIFINLMIFICSVILLTSFSKANDSVYVWSVLDEEALQTSSIPNQKGNFLNLTSQSAILVEQKTGEILYEHNSHEQLRPASVTKIMTLLLIMEALDSGKITLEDRVPCSETAAAMGGSQIWLDTTENLTVDEMLKAICIVSANDCAVAMAEYLCGSEDTFVAKMNEKAKSLGMLDTCFKNCHGLDEDGHLTSSYDVALMSKELLNNHPNITKYTTIWMDSLRDGKSSLVNTNKLLRNYQGATGLKTGSTSLALFNISASATKNDLSLIAVIMRGETSDIRFDEAKKLLDYGFNNFEYVSLGESLDTIKNLPVNKGTLGNVDIVFETEAATLVPKGMAGNISANIVLPNSIDAPINKGDKIGEVVFTLNGDEIDSINLIAFKTIPKLSFANTSIYIFKNWFSLLR